jgi:hypothetical protein
MDNNKRNFALASTQPCNRIKTPNRREVRSVALRSDDTACAALGRRWATGMLISSHSSVISGRPFRLRRLPCHLLPPYHPCHLHLCQRSLLRLRLSVQHLRRRLHPSRSLRRQVLQSSGARGRSTRRCRKSSQ